MVRMRLSGGEGYAWNLLQVVDEVYIVPIAEEGSESFALAVADLEGDEAVGFEQGPGLRDEAAVDVETFGATEKGCVRLVVADLGVESWTVGFWDVGWVADDRIVRRFADYGGQEIGLEEGDPVGYGVDFRIGLGDLESFE
jgi:hypothetical protein